MRVERFLWFWGLLVFLVGTGSCVVPMSDEPPPDAHRAHHRHQHNHPHETGTHHHHAHHHPHPPAGDHHHPY